MRYLVVDINSSNGGPDMDGNEDWTRYVRVEAATQASACVKARDGGFDGLLMAMADAVQLSEACDQGQ
ncbi:MAG: hypothetical protein KBE22_00155 [Candidatus Accumulibacter sp.]|nr:hypothetical protein [Accumulibacter sp.]